MTRGQLQANSLDSRWGENTRIFYGYNRPCDLAPPPDVNNGGLASLPLSLKKQCFRSTLFLSLCFLPRLATLHPHHITLRSNPGVFFYLVPTAFSSTPLDLINTDRGYLQVPGAHCADFVI